ncbi:17-beta-hydroxysteroid dehydrogenase 13-like [Chironomus tepperi]|uniref:17-beta-hydroxysteroid dehydrogenase 13-like n=1 Tax=Chironomus tepperi TaxID=113505 RepID=UPI00391F73B6
MFNINELMKQEYRPAINPKSKSSYKLKLIFLAYKIVLISLFDTIVALFKKCNPRKLENISKKLALVTGGGNGLGRSICFRLAQEGCDLAIADIDFKAACQTAAEIQEKYKNICKPYHCDVSDKNAIYKLKNDIESEMRGVDILVNNAGLLYMSNFLTCNVDDIQRTVNVNLTSQMMMSRIFLTGMIERKYGKIMTICSIASIVGGPTLVVYSATKRGLDGFMRSFADELLSYWK